MSEAIVLGRGVAGRLLDVVRARHPTKTFGYLVSDRDSDPWTATDFVTFEVNIRNDDHWREEFVSSGRYFLDHSDAGFVASPEEAWRVQKQVWERRATEVGVFHTHRRHPANFSRLDYEMHVHRFDGLWHLIVSMRNPRLPRIRAFAVSGEGVRELDVRQEHAAGAPRA